MPKPYRPTRRLTATQTFTPATQTTIDFGVVFPQEPKTATVPQEIDIVDTIEAAKPDEGQQTIEFVAETPEAPAAKLDSNDLPSTQEVAALQMTQIPHPAPPDQSIPVEPVVDEQLKSLPTPSEPIAKPDLHPVIQPTDYSRETKKPRR